MNGSYLEEQLQEQTPGLPLGPVLWNVYDYISEADGELVQVNPWTTLNWEEM